MLSGSRDEHCANIPPPHTHCAGLIYLHKVMVSSPYTPIQSDSVFFELIFEILCFAAPHLISLTNLQCMNKPNARQFKCPLCTIDVRYPGVSPPVREYARIVIAEYVDVTSMNKVVREYIFIASFVQWPNHSDIWWRKVVLYANKSYISIMQSILIHFYPRDAMLARVLVIATCPSVRLSVCPSRAGIVSKRRKLVA